MKLLKLHYAKFSVLSAIITSLFSSVLLSTNPSFSVTIEENVGATNSPTNHTLNTFNDPESGLSFQYPLDWEVASDEYLKSLDPPDDTVVLMVPKSLGEVSIMLITQKEMPISISSDEYIELAKIALTGEKISIGDAIPVSIKSLQGSKYNVTESGEVIQTHVIFMKDTTAIDIAYVLDKANMAKNLEDIESMINSFEIKKVAIDDTKKDDITNNKTYIVDTKNNNDPLSTIVNSKDYFTNIDKGNELFDEEKYEEAITYYDKALDTEPNSIEALQNKGVALYNSGKYKEAVTYFDKVLTFDPNNADALKVKKASQSFLQEITATDRTENNDTPDLSNDNNFNNTKETTRKLITYALNSFFPETGEKFTNTEHGVDMTLPKNWTGIEWRSVFPLAIVSPEGINVTDLFSPEISATVDSIVEEINSGGNVTELAELAEQKMQYLNKPVITKLLQYFTDRTSSMAIYIYGKQFAREANSFSSNSTMPINSQTSLYERHTFSESANSGCFRKSLDQITLKSNISAEKVTDQCFLGLDGNRKQDNIHYFVLTPSAVVYIRYTYDPDKENDKSLQEFEESLKSLSVEESLPINNQTIQQFLNG